MNIPKINRKTLLIIAAILILLLCIIFFLFYSRINSEKENVITPTPFKPSPVQTLDKKTKPIKLPISEDDPRLWLDENGDPIEEVD
jgi:uncharacterized membrane protein YvbJ